MSSFISSLSGQQIETVLTGVRSAEGLVYSNGEGTIRTAGAGDVADALSNGSTTPAQKVSVRQALGLPMTTLSLTLPASGWSSKQITVSATGMSATSVVIVSPAASSFLDYSQSKIRALGQGTNTMTFVCEELPEYAITVNVLIVA